MGVTEKKIPSFAEENDSSFDDGRLEIDRMHDPCTFLRSPIYHLTSGYVQDAAAYPSCDSPNTSRHFPLGARDVFQVPAKTQPVPSLHIIRMREAVVIKAKAMHEMINR